MLALIAICVAFQPTRLDDTIHTALREKFGDQLLKLQRGGPESLPIFEELFKNACPNFISPVPPDFDNPETNIDPKDHHLSVFMDEVKTNMWSPTVKSYLRLYTTMDLKKLAGFLEVQPEELRSWLLVTKQRTKQLRWTEQRGLLDGELINVSDLDYALEGVSIFRIPGRWLHAMLPAVILDAVVLTGNHRTLSTFRKPRLAASWWTGICAT